MKQTLKSGALIAAAVATLALSGTVSASSASATADSVHCTGINSCKGTSECKTAENACKGQNSCKGHGWVNASADECKTKGGKVAHK